MACWPAGTGAIHHSLGEAHKIRHTGRNLVDAVGGRIVNFPLIPQNRRLTAEESAELEIRRAIRAGSTGSPLTPGPAETGPNRRSTGSSPPRKK